MVCTIGAFAWTFFWGAVTGAGTLALLAFWWIKRQK